MRDGTGERAVADALLDEPAVRRACDHIRATDERTIAEMLELVQIPAPPFGESARGAWMRERFRALGLADVVVDDVGNVLAHYPATPGNGDGPGPVLVAAHLDPIFPAETALQVRRAQGRIHAPGISDNCRGLAALLAISRALLHAHIRPAAPVVLAANVGEEGVGDLRGMKHLFREGAPWRSIQAFISVDGTGVRRIVTRGVGSRRLRVTVEGPGGPSWADWGTANPLHALGMAVGDLARITPVRQPRTVLTVGRMGGGTSVNAIPDSAWLELDIRSEAAQPLHDLETRVRRILAQATAEANAHRRRGTPALSLSVESSGDRPTGETPASATLVRAARAATRAIGEVPEMVSSSTDANAPMALGIPAIAMGAGGEAGGTHTLDEWYSNEKGPEGIERVLLTVLAVAGLAS